MCPCEDEAFYLLPLHIKYVKAYLTHDKVLWCCIYDALHHSFPVTLELLWNCRRASIFQAPVATEAQTIAASAVKVKTAGGAPTHVLQIGNVFFMLLEKGLYL